MRGISGSSRLSGSQAQTSVPCPGALRRRSWPRSASTRKRMPSSPCEPSVSRSGSKPWPLSATTTMACAYSRLSVTSTSVARAYLAVLVSASCTSRKAVNCALAGSSTAGSRLMRIGTPSRSEVSRHRISSAGTRPSWSSVDGRRSSMMRRLSAMPLLSVSVRWLSRCIRSGAPACSLGRSRATSSLAAVSSAPSSSCRSRARRARSSSRAVCRWRASWVSSAVRRATSTSSRSRSARTSCACSAR